MIACRSPRVHRTPRLLLAALAIAGLAAITVVRSPGAGVTRAMPSPVLAFHCALDATCPEISVTGDPPATLGGDPAPFRGYGDPSLEYDPVTGALWLSYSWLNVLVTNPVPPPVLDLGVRTHLARSDDGGASFTFVRPVNVTASLLHPDTNAAGWTVHEVSTLLRAGDGSWQLLWLTYFDPVGESPGPEDRRDFYYTRSLGATPTALGDIAQPWARGYGTSPSFGAIHNLSLIPQLADCAVFTEPALFTHEGVVYLATNCAVFSGGVRQDAQDRLVLLRQEVSGYSFVGNLMTSADAADLGASRFEQADLALSKTGRILLIGTPIQHAAPEHLGCVVFEVTDISTAQLRRDASGDAVQLAAITGDDDTIGPGLCTYDANSTTGVIMVLHIQQTDPFDLDFSMRATGVHPDAAAPPSVGGAAKLPELRASPGRDASGRNGIVYIAGAAATIALVFAVAFGWHLRGIRPS